MIIRKNTDFFLNDEAKSIFENMDLVRVYNNENNNYVNYNDIESFIESYGVDEVLQSISERNGIDNISIVFDEANIIENPNIVYDINDFYVREINSNDPIYKLTEEVIEEYINTGNESILDLYINESASDVIKNIGGILTSSIPKLQKYGKLFDTDTKEGQIAQSAIKTGEKAMENVKKGDVGHVVGHVAAGINQIRKAGKKEKGVKGAVKSMTNLYRGVYNIHRAGLNPIKAFHSTDKLFGHPVEKGAAAVAATGAALYGANKLRKRYKEKKDMEKRNIISRKIASLRKAYRRLVERAKKVSGSKANILKKAAAKILIMIDKLLSKLKFSKRK